MNGGELQEERRVMWDHHEVLRFSLVWAAIPEAAAAKQILGRAIYATYRGQQVPRSEPNSGFQVHRLEERGVHYLKVLFRDSRECKLRLLRQMLFSEFKRALVEGRVYHTSTFAFQMTDSM